MRQKYEERDYWARADLYSTFVLRNNVKMLIFGTPIGAQSGMWHCLWPGNPPGLSITPERINSEPSTICLPFFMLSWSSLMFSPSSTVTGKRKLSDTSSFLSGFWVCPEKQIHIFSASLLDHTGLRKAFSKCAHIWRFKIAVHTRGLQCFKLNGIKRRMIDIGKKIT